MSTNVMVYPTDYNLIHENILTVINKDAMPWVDNFSC